MTKVSAVKSRFRFGFLLLAGGAAVAALIAMLHRQPSEQETVASVDEQRSAIKPNHLIEQSQADVQAAAQPRPSTDRSMDQPSLEVSFVPGVDVLGFIERLLAPARSGNREAQYAIYEAMEYCNDAYEGYFDRGTKRLTLDEALTWASTRPAINMDAIRTSYASCSAFKSADVSQFEPPDVWLERASSLGLPKAQARNAGRLLLDARLATLPRNATSEDRSGVLESQRSEARGLMLRALNSNDASATWEVAHNLMFLGGHSASDEGQMWIWRLAACKQGYDCSSNAAWVVSECYMNYYCQPGESGVAYIRRNAAQVQPDIDRRATELAARLERGSIGDAEFESLLTNDSG